MIGCWAINFLLQLGFVFCICHFCVKITNNHFCLVCLFLSFHGVLSETAWLMFLRWKELSLPVIQQNNTKKISTNTFMTFTIFFVMHTSKHNLNSSKMLNNLQNIVLYKTLKTFSIISLTRGTPVESSGVKILIYVYCGLASKLNI